MLDYKKWYDSCSILLKLGFDLEKNNAGDLLGAINEVYNSFEDYEHVLDSSQES